MARAVRFDHYGGPEVLYIADVDTPAPPPGEVLVAVRAAGINPGEASIRQGNLDKLFPTTFPSGEGSDLAGVVSQIADGADSHRAATSSVAGLQVGDEVLGWTDSRASHAEFVSVPADQLIRKPKDMSFEVAGSLFVVGVTAYAAVRAVGAGPGDTVVVSAAAGGVGSIAVQLLKLKGARVIGIASEPHHDSLRSLGATPVAYGDDLADRIREVAPDGVDAFVDTFGADYVPLAIELGVDRDRINTIAAFDAGDKYGVKTDGNAVGSDPKVLAEVTALVASRQVEVPIAATYPLDEVRAAFDELAKRHTHGKIVLIP